MTTIVTRATKGSALTWTEGDANITNLNNDKMENFTVAGDSGSSQTISGGNTLTIAGGTGLSSVASATDTITLNLDNTSVTAASYTNANITVDAQGRITNASDGTAFNPASPGAIGGTTPAAGTFTGLTVKGDGATAKLILDNTAVSATWWGTTGIGLKIQAATYTNNSSAAGTVPGQFTHSIAGGTFASTNAITITDAGTLYLGVPLAGTNTTFTNTYSIFAGGRIKGSDFVGTIGATTPSTGAFTTLSAATTTLDDIRETVFNFGNSGATTITPDAANGSIQTITATGNFTLNAFASPVAGQTITFLIQQDGTGNRTMTSTMKFAGGSKTLSTAASSYDILTVSYLGAAGYFASLAKGFA